MNRYAKLTVVIAALLISFCSETYNGLWFAALIALLAVVAVEFRTWWSAELATEAAESLR